MNEFFNNATTVTVGDGFTAFECVKAKFMKDYSASYRDGNSQLTKKWLKGDIIHGYLIQDKLNKYVETGVNSLCPKSGEAKIDVPANNSTIITIFPKQPAIIEDAAIKPDETEKPESGVTTITMNKKGAYLLAGLFVLIGLMLVSKN